MLVNQKLLIHSIMMLSVVKTILLPLLLITPSLSFGVAGWSMISEDSSVVQIGNCTGTRISNDGHILTARHCFNGCLISGNFVEINQLFPEYGWRSAKLYKLNQRASCSTTIDGHKKGIEVVATGPGFMIPTEQRSLIVLASDIYNDFLKRSYLHNGDFAIIKEETTKKTSCRNVNWDRVNQKDQVTFRGFPIESSGRPLGRNSNGVSLFEGSGVIVGSILENSCIGEDEYHSKGLINLINRYDRDDLLLSTVDNLPGVSGSSLLNNSGEIIGVINSQYRKGIDVQSTYCSGSTVAIPMHHIRSLLEEGGFKEEQIHNFFDCQEMNVF